MISALRYEWRRIRSIRSTWIMSGLTVAQAAGLVFLITLISSGMQTADLSIRMATTLDQMLPFVFYPIFPVLLSVIAAQAFGHDYRHGTIRLTLSAFPRRWEVLLARIFTALAFLVTTAIISAAIVGVIIDLQPDVTGGFDWEGSIATVGRLLAFVSLYIITVMALTILTRNLALGMVIPMVMLIFLENILAMISQIGEKWNWVIDWLPMYNAGNWLMQQPDFAGVGAGSLVPLGVFAGVLSLGAAWRFLLRDA